MEKLNAPAYLILQLQALAQADDIVQSLRKKRSYFYILLSDVKILVLLVRHQHLLQPTETPIVYEITYSF